MSHDRSGSKPAPLQTKGCGTRPEKKVEGTPPGVSALLGGMRSNGIQELRSFTHPWPDALEDDKLRRG